MKRFYFPALIIFIAILSGWNSSVFAQTTFPVPNVPGCSGVSGVIVTMRGGGGGTSNSAGTGFPDGGAGGFPGAITCTLNVITPTVITSLTYYVGMVGGTGVPVLTGTAGIPGGTGYGTGGSGGNFAGPTGGIGTDVPGGGGGGSSAVLNGGTVLFVAAGGGGGGALMTSLTGGNGGNPGTAGANAGTYNYGGSGGSSGVGGAAGGVGLNYNGSPGGAVPTGNGGNGGEGLTGSQSGGGGGAGWGGGGGGGAGNLPGVGTTIGVNTSTGAGGGGCNYVNATTVTTGLTNGTATVGGNGIVTLTLYPAAIGTCFTLCPGATRTLTETTPGGVWSSSNAAIASVSPTTGSPVTVTAGVSAGTATISYTEPSGYYAFVVVTVLAPTSPITGPPSVCAGQTITLSDATTGGTWVSGTTSVATISATGGVVTGITPGTTDITYTPPASCPVTYTVTVTTSPSPITGPPSVCTGSTIQLSDTYSGGTWTSSNTSAATIDPATGVLSGVAPGTTTITYTLGGSCLVTAIITVNQIAPVTGTTTLCLGSTTVLSDVVPGGTWSSGTPTVATIGLTSGILYSVSPGTSTITYTTPAGCTATVVATVDSIYPITGTTVLCAELTTPLSDATSGTWSSSNVGVATIGSADGIVYGVAGGTTTITFNTPLGCSAQITVTVNPKPVISGADSTNPDSCGVLDGKIVLNGLTPGTSYILTYTYNGTPVPAATYTAPVTITSLDSGTYTNFVVQDATTGCISISFGPVYLSDPPNPPPPVITSNSPLCEYETLLLVATDAMPGGFYSWAGPNEFTSGIYNPSIVGTNYADTGIYTVIYTVNNCISLPGTSDVTIEPPSPLTNVTLSQTISYGSSIQLNADNAYYYTWTPNNGTLNNPNINNPIATPEVTTTYTVYGMTVFGCLDSAFVTITVDSTMNVGIPTGFTPNGDGLNDVFRPVGVKFQRLVEFRVYNRWGQQVFYSNNAEHGWDGTFNGVPQDMGVYYYQVIIANPGGTGENIVYKGDVTLIR